MTGREQTLDSVQRAPGSPLTLGTHALLTVLASWRRRPHGMGEEVRLREAEHSSQGTPAEGESYPVAPLWGSGSPLASCPYYGHPLLGREAPGFLSLLS